MCGLVGLAGDTTGAWKDVFQELLLCDAVRGIHSTGAASVHRITDGIMLVKEPGHPFNLFERSDFVKMTGSNNPSKCLIGHNRYATVGGHTEENAHPFAFEHVVGAHNGTLDKFGMKDLHNQADYGTDSEAIFATINEIGAEATMKLISGAWALTWYDKRFDTLNMLRNDKRPLFYTYSFDRSTIIWASEKSMLEYVLRRKNKTVKGQEYFEVEKDMHYSWKIPKTIIDKFGHPTKSKVEGKKYTYVQVPFGRAAHTVVTYPDFTGAQRTISTSTSTAGKSIKRIDIKKFRHPYKDIRGHAITRDQFENMVEEGCSFCGRNDQKWNDFIHIMGSWVGPKNTPFICEQCYGDDDVLETSRYVL